MSCIRLTESKYKLTCKIANLICKNNKKVKVPLSRGLNEEIFIQMKNQFSNRVNARVRKSWFTAHFAHETGRSAAMISQFICERKKNPFILNFFRSASDCDVNVITPHWMSSNYLNAQTSFCRLPPRKLNYLCLKVVQDTNMYIWNDWSWLDLLWRKRQVGALCAAGCVLKHSFGSNKKPFYSRC